MKKSYLVYKIDTFNGMELVAEADTLELCKNFLKKDNFRVIECFKKGLNNV